MITKTLRRTRKRSILGAKGMRTASLWARSVVAIVLASLLAGGPFSPVFAQSPAQNPPANPAPAAQPAPDGASIAPVASLGLSKHDFSHGPSEFPNILKPYESIHIERPVLTNSPRLDQLIQNGKLEISLQDAVELALENSLDIAVQRYYPWIADAGILNANSGSSGFGTPGATYSGSSALINPFTFTILTFDPIISSTLSVADVSTPINNPFSSGAGTSTAAIASHSFQSNNQYSQTFETGTNITASWNNSRDSSSASANFLNPYVQSALSVTLTQPLLNGYGLAMGTRNIRIAKNDRKIADWAFAQQAITTVTNTITAYWELVYARENVKVNQQAVDVAQKLYEDNKKQLQIGSIAPLDVTRSESEVATDTGTLVVAQTVQLQDEQTLKNYISKDPLAPNMINVEIIPTDEPKQPAMIETASFEDSVKEAFAKRPDLQEQVYNVKNAEIDVQATRNALLPSLSASAYYSSIGLAGNSSILGAPTLVSTGIPIVDGTGTPVLLNGTTPIYQSTTTAAVTGTIQQGFTTAQSQIFHNQFPTYAGQLTLTLPLRNRSAQAVHARALLQQRQLETEVQVMRNAALLDVRNSYIQLTQDRAQVASAIKARQLQQETFDAEQKKYQLGASTTYLVIQTQRDLIAAQGTELRALANLEEAKANYERAVGRTLEVNHVTIADAESGEVEHATLIPGTLHGKVVGVEDLFKDLPDRSER